jgi:hypothetical protein
MAAVSRLSAADRFAIEDLFALYHWALDTADVDGFTDTFVEDSVVDLQFMGRISRHRGRAGLVDLAESMRAWNRFPGVQHFSGQQLFAPEGDNRCRVRSFVFVAECRGEPPYELRFAGRSDDLLVRHEGRWLFQQRLVRLWQDDAMCNRPLELE